MSFDLVMFGGTGDLAWRKLMPALFQAFRHGTLPEGGRIIGVGRDDLSHDQYRALIQSRCEKVELAKRPSAEEFARFAAILEFVRMDLSKSEDYARLAETLNARNADGIVMYVATAPSLFTNVCEQLAASRVRSSSSLSVFSNSATTARGRRRLPSVHSFSRSSAPACISADRPRVCTPYSAASSA